MSTVQSLVTADEFMRMSFDNPEPPVTFAVGRELTSDQLPGFSCPVAEFIAGV